MSCFVSQPLWNDKGLERGLINRHACRYFENMSMSLSLSMSMHAWRKDFVVIAGNLLFPLSVECRKCERPRESGRHESFGTDGLLPNYCIASTGKKS